ncbi:MAG: DUF5702 domain-containing protein [Peptococcaceae bacterium]|jgi:hypothetical protein|nr:DUF5702 domain-containing protein [Peptococcaceae bacterium]MDH7525096.1 DUF5702 domain-containing protein [Peptococcaceae bacterium]
MNVVKNCRGAVTLFLVIIFTALLVLTGVLVDAARIMAAENRVSATLASAARSALAACHEGLSAEFGIYGSLVKSGDIEEYLRRNLKEEAGGFNMVRYEVLSVQTAAGASDSLENNETIKEQILQYVKYRVPLSTSENLLERLAGCGLEGKAGFMESGRQAAAARARLKTECAAINKRKEEIIVSLGDLREAPIGFAQKAASALEELEEMLDSRLMPLIKEYEDNVRAYNEKNGSPKEFLNEETALLRQKVDILRKQINQSAAALERIDSGRAGPPGVSGRHAPILDEYLAAFREMEGLVLADLSVKPQVKHNGAGLSRVLDFIEKRLPLKKMRDNGIEREIPGEAEGEEGWSVFLTGAGRLEPQEINEGLAASEGERVSSYLRQLGQRTADLALQGRDNFYLTWYIMDKCTYLTSATVRDHYFQKGEVEYIIGGNASELTNLLTVFRKIFFLRYAVNVLQCFLESRITHPFFRLASALAGGIPPACTDVARLYQGEEVPFYPELPGLKMKYSDYLRLFLLLQSEETRLDRIKQLMEVNMREMRQEENFALSAYRAACRAAAEVEINLWFIPALHLENFKSGKYRLKCETFVGY